MNKKLAVFLSAIFIVIIAMVTARLLIPHLKKETPAKAPVSRTTKEKRPVKKQPSAQVKMAVILDDWGHNVSHVDDALEARVPLTLAVIPHLPHSADVARKAHEGGLGVMLHMPMQPKGSKQPTEPHTIRLTSTDEQIIDYLDEALNSVPFAEGMNNHQGSAATSDLRVMRTVLAHLKKERLFFVDSHVIATTVGAKVARELGVPHTKRDVFIDNDPEEAAVVHKLKEAERFALSHGRAVVIGHDKSATLEALKKTVPEMQKNGIRFVLVKELLE